MSNSTLPPLPDTPGVVRSKTEKKTESKRMEITIHVCDETKNLKKDFTCPRNLLLNEMKYFQDYLSADTQAWEDIDISVHCDVKIFDWLIRYVKKENKVNGPILDTKTAVSILISSDFLKMENLVKECIQFCHDHMTEIIASPCNMNCINDALVQRIASSFTQHDLEKVYDKKDKFKSKLFCKKIEELFDPTYSSQYSQNNASALFKCLYCGKLLLPAVEDRIECTVSRTIVDRYGNLRYIHSRDSSWDATGYLLSTKQQLKTWRAVFWRLWSTINYLECSVCEKIFPLCEYNKCRYHLEKPISQVHPDSGMEQLIYPCCGNKAMLFEPIACTTECQYRDHQVNLTDTLQEDNTKNINYNSSYIFNEFLPIRDLVREHSCEHKIPNLDSSSYSLEAMIKTELTRLNHYVSIISKEDKRDRKRPPSQKFANNGSGKSSQSFNRSKSNKRNRIPMEEDDSDIDEQGIVRIVIQHKDTPSLNKNLAKTWNNDLPVRLNQDVQRESDVRRMNDVIRELTIARKSSVSGGQSQTTATGGKCEAADGGMYHRIENKLRAALATHALNSTNSSTSNQSKHVNKNR